MYAVLFLQNRKEGDVTRDRTCCSLHERESLCFQAMKSAAITEIIATLDANSDGVI